MNKSWSHLPNASLIDWVLKSLKTNTDSWNRARDAARDAARNVAWNAAYAAIWGMARDATLRAAWGMARDVAYDAARGVGYDTARDSLLALVAYDDCRQYLDMTYDQLKIYALLSEKPAAVLLLPMKWVQENECLVTPA